jgi:hypothetical protein
LAPVFGGENALFPPDTCLSALDDADCSALVAFLALSSAALLLLELDPLRQFVLTYEDAPPAPKSNDFLSSSSSSLP